MATVNRIESRTGVGELLKASLGSIEYITSLCKSEDESNRIKEVVSTSTYRSEFVHAALFSESKGSLTPNDIDDIVSLVRKLSSLLVVVPAMDISSDLTELGRTPVAVVSAGERDGDEFKRNTDVNEIHQRTHFHSVSKIGLPKRIHDHERII